MNVDSVDHVSIKTVNLLQSTGELSEMLALSINWEPNITISGNTDQTSSIGALSELRKLSLGLFHLECADIRVPIAPAKNVGVDVVFDWMSTRNCVTSVARDDIVLAVALYYTNVEIASTTRSGACLVQDDSSIVKTGSYLSCADAWEGLQFTVFGRLLNGLLSGWCYEQSKED